MTVLAGVSGTGKTLLPILYSRYMGMLQLTISVQPRWDSPQDLFGFYNYLERRYKATELSRLLYAYQNNEELQKRMAVVLFDEMNLARTEYYFSDFLSKLELRRAGSADAALTIALSQPVRLDIPTNMLMVGTMNEDESTQTLSDKVLDRANVLRFGKPTSQVTLEKKKELTNQGLCVTRQLWDYWCEPQTLADNQTKEVRGWLAELNDAMDRLGRPFGYRVQEAILEYVRQYPVFTGSSYKLAFADQIEQKILPKLRGVDTMHRYYDESLSRIQAVVEHTSDKELTEALQSAVQSAQEQGQFIWMGVNRTIAKK